MTETQATNESGKPSRAPSRQTSAPLERSIGQRQRLLRAAAGVFADRGLKHATVEAILQASGLGRGTFYRHFPNLEAAFIAVKAEAGDRFFTYVATKVAEAPNPRDRLAVGIRAFLTALKDLGDFARVLYAERPSLDEHRKVRDRIIRRFVQLFQLALSQTHREGRIARVPDELTIFTVVAGLEAVAISFVDKGINEIPEEAHQTLLTFCRCALALGPDAG